MVTPIQPFTEMRAIPYVFEHGFLVWKFCATP
jgi:hypothetical protein